MMPKHKEAFCLMWYACRYCDHMERMWNSRDGVTPFTTQCPSCGAAMGLQHQHWDIDEYAPNHEPWDGQGVWVDMTWEQAQRYARRRLAASAAHGWTIIEADLPALAATIYHDGQAPDLVRWGFDRRDEARRPGWLPESKPS